VSTDIALPQANRPVGSYTMAVRSGDLLFLSGHGAFDDGEPRHLGRLGESMTTAEGARAAEAVMKNLLATVRDQLGDLDRVARMVKVLVFVNSAPDFDEQHLVANGATDLLVEVFGERVGSPARSAIGVAALPLGFSVEIEAVVEIGMGGNATTQLAASRTSAVSTNCSNRTISPPRTTK
jgi:enamine deaminase RidA (YjgF/YER057c/UK114 family)